MAIDWLVCGGGSSIGGVVWIEDAVERVDVDVVAEVVHVIQVAVDFDTDVVDIVIDSDVGVAEVAESFDTDVAEVTVDSDAGVAEVMLEGAPVALGGCEVCGGKGRRDHVRCMAERRIWEGRRRKADDGRAMTEAN